MKIEKEERTMYRCIFTGLAACGLLSNISLGSEIETLATDCVNIADALLNELEKEK